MSWTTRIYVALLGEKVDVWRPVEAERVGESAYRILEQAYDPDVERWRFEPGDLVQCESIQVRGQRILAATSKLDSLPDEL